MNKIIITIALLTLIFSLSAQSGNTQENGDTFITLMDDSCSSRFKIEQDSEGNLLASGTIVKYNFSRYSTHNGTIIPCLIKSETVAQEWLHHASHDKKYQVTLTIFPDYDQKSSFSYTKPTQVFEKKEDYLFAANYGCCDNPTYYELSTFPGNQTFLACNKRYHVVGIPSTMKYIYFGYLANQDSATLSEGLLGWINYSINKQEMRSIAIYNGDPKLEIAQIPDFRLFSHNMNDLINDGDKDYDFMYAASLQGEIAAKLWKGIGVTATFYEKRSSKKRKEAKVQLELKDGTLGEGPIILQFQKPTK